MGTLARPFDDCREGQIPRCLQRYKFDVPLLAAGFLTDFLYGTAVIVALDSHSG